MCFVLAVLILRVSFLCTALVLSLSPRADGNEVIVAWTVCHRHGTYLI
jgi:hypothetical protein